LQQNNILKLPRGWQWMSLRVR